MEHRSPASLGMARPVFVQAAKMSRLAGSSSRIEGSEYFFMMRFWFGSYKGIAIMDAEMGLNTFFILRKLLYPYLRDRIFGLMLPGLLLNGLN
jgi:hypothetical protein